MSRLGEMALSFILEMRVSSQQDPTHLCFLRKGTGRKLPTTVAHPVLLPQPGRTLPFSLA